MASPFLGLNVHVRLRNPPSSLHGHVANVEGQRLHLREVRFLRSGKQLKEYIVHGAEIEDIEVLPSGASLSQDVLDGRQDGQTQLAEACPQVAQRVDAHAHADVFPTMNAINAPQQPLAAQPPRGPRMSSTGESYLKPQQATSLRPAQLGPTTQKPFVDPAILGFERTPASDRVELSVASPSKLSTPSDPAILGYNKPAPTGGLSSTVRLEQRPTPYRNSSVGITAAASAIIENGQQALAREKEEPRNVAATLSAPFDVLHVGKGKKHDVAIEVAPRVIGQDPAEVESSNIDAGAAGKSRRRRKRPHQGPEQAAAIEFDSMSETTQQPEKHHDSSGTGWRETPILQQATKPKSLREEHAPEPLRRGEARMTPLTSGPQSQSSRRERAMRIEADKNGWATEDATDVRGMGDFDFEGNLSKFDKKSVWQELRNGDTTADEDRLVSFNRVKAPGTFGGQKLHPTENVLSRSRTASRDYESDSDLELHVAAASSLKQLRRNPSRASLRLAPSRKESLKAASYAPSAAPVIGDRLTSHPKLSDIPRSNSPRLQGYVSPSSSVFSRSGQPSGGQAHPKLRYTSTNRGCRNVGPETLQAIENLAYNGFGLSEDILAENAGRGIAEVVFSVIDPGGRRLEASNHNSFPIVVVLVGENRAGSRALAAARHLIERNVHVLASLTGQVDLESGPLSAQIHRFRGKIIRNWEETSASLKNLNAPPELIIDGLLGAHESFESLPSDQFQTAMEMLAWANRSRASVLSLDIPSGVDASTGAVQMREGEPVEIRAKIVVCCGIPCTGLLEAMIARRGEDGWRVYVADIGINPASRPFMKMNTNKAEGTHKGRFIEFGTEWVVGLVFDAGNGVAGNGIAGNGLA